MPSVRKAILQFYRRFLLSDLDGLKALEPDLILVDAEPENADALAMEGLPVAVILPATGRSDFEREYAEVGSALNGQIDGAGICRKSAPGYFSCDR